GKTEEATLPSSFVSSLCSLCGLCGEIFPAHPVLTEPPIYATTHAAVPGGGRARRRHPRIGALVMATDSAHATTLLRRARPTLGRLWELPTFLLGVAALVGVWQGRTYWHLTPPVTGEIKAARQALEADDLLKAVES